MTPGEPERARAIVVNKRGLHARASAKFVETAARFDAQVHVSKGDTTVDGCSIMGLMMLGAGLGSELELSATGPQAREAIAALVHLIVARFDEDS
jgi:phosphocarrier protein HPr